MKNSEVIIVDHLMRSVIKTQAFEAGGLLLSDIVVGIDSLRSLMPTLLFLSRSQMVAAVKGEKLVSSFVIEILSDDETLENIETKLRDYVKIGVKLIWYVIPNSRRVYAYSGVSEIKIYDQMQTATALQVLPDFEIDIKKLFTIE